VADNPTPAQTPKRRNGLIRMILILLVGIMGPAAVAGGGLYVYLKGGRFVSTENAYIKSDKIAISADVSGRVVEVGVSENEMLEAGQLLFRIDDEPFRIAVAQANAQLASARNEIESLRALHKQRLAELKLAEGDIEFYQREVQRQDKLSKKGFSSQTNLDAAEKNLRNARDRIGTIQQDIAQALADLAGDPKIGVNAHPLVREARAARDRAALDMRRTRVAAPAPGVVTNFELQVGEYIEEGEPVFSLIGTRDVWVEANFKETDLTHVRAGQQATVRVDTYPDISHAAVITGISPATGAEFALLPPQNATGNWVKVVQRLPIRLILTNPATDAPLRAGMSVTVEIDTGNQRDWASLVSATRSWLNNLL